MHGFKAPTVRLGLPMLLALALWAPSSQAQLFPDNEARKAILELRERLNTQQTETSARLDKLEGLTDQALQQSQQATRNQIDILQQLDTLRRENAALRGTVEVLQKQLADTQKRLNDIYADVDARLKKHEPQRITLEGREVLVDPDQTRAYNAAFEQFRASQFAQAVAGFSGFLSVYPGSPYAPLAQFWLGNAQYASRDFKSAVATLQAFAKANTDSPRLPDALLTIANCQIELGDKKSARTTLRTIVDQYGTSTASQSARDRLATLK